MKEQDACLSHRYVYTGVCEGQEVFLVQEVEYLSFIFRIEATKFNNVVVKRVIVQLVPRRAFNKRGRHEHNGQREKCNLHGGRNSMDF